MYTYADVNKYKFMYVGVRVKFLSNSKFLYDSRM